MKVNVHIRSSALFIFANVLGQLFSLLSLAAFTRLMTNAEYGRYVTYYAFVSVFVVFIGGNLYFSLNNAYIDKADRIHEFRKSTLGLSLMIASMWLLTVCSAGFLVFQNWSIPLVTALHSLGFFVVCYATYSANMENKAARKFWLLIVPNLLQFILPLLYMLISDDRSFLSRAFWSALGVCIVAFPLCLCFLRTPGPIVNTKDWKYALAISIPTIPMSLSSLLLLHCDKMMLTWLKNAEQTAIYSVVYYVSFGLLVVFQAINPVRQAWIFRKLSKNDVYGVHTMQKWYLAFLAFCVMGLFMVAPLVLELLAPQQYRDLALVAPFVAGASVSLLYSFFAEIFLFYKKNWQLSLCVLVGAGSNIILNYLFIPQFGGAAAAYATLVSNLIMFILTGFLVGKYSGVSYSWLYFLLFLIFLAVNMILYFFLIDKSGLLRYAVYVAFLGIMAVWVQTRRREIMQMILE